MINFQKHQPYQLALFGRNCNITAVDFDTDNWQQGRNVYLFYSLKNHAFSGRLLKWYFLLCYHHKFVGHISVVDLPYLANEKAELGCDLIEADFERIAVIAREKERHIERVLCSLEHEKRDIRNYVKRMVWGDLVKQTPAWIQDDIRAAYENKGAFYQAVVNQTRVMRRNIASNEQLENYAEFILAELPTLLHLYYSHPIGFVDVYPGKNMGFYLALEQGSYAQELPRISQFVLQAKPLIYIDAQ